MSDEHGDVTNERWGLRSELLGKFNSDQCDRGIKITGRR